MTHFLKDILRQPSELGRTLDYLTGPGTQVLTEAKKLVASATHTFLTGIGSSWHAALGASALFYNSGKPVYLIDAAELLHYAKIPPGSVIIMLSRTGRSIEVVRLIEKVHASGSQVIGITNGPDGNLARQSDLTLLMDVRFDYSISVNTFSTLALASGALAVHIGGGLSTATTRNLRSAIDETESLIPAWQEQIEHSLWLNPDAAYYFLARGSSLSSANEARLLWEEGVKHAATAMGTGPFRHGPQEVSGPNLHAGIWIDQQKMRNEDLAVARDLKRIGARVMTIGQNLQASDSDLALSLPQTPGEWQFVIDAIPAQLAAERLARLAGVDSDSFRFCSYIVEDEGGLLNPQAQ